MNDIIRMQQLAGILTEGQARKMMEILSEASSDLTKLEDYIDDNSFGIEVLDEPESTITFQFWDTDPPELQDFENLLNKLNLNFKKSKERSEGGITFIYKVDKAGVKQLFGAKDLEKWKRKTI
jgi:hypothetical protein